MVPKTQTLIVETDSLYLESLIMDDKVVLKFRMPNSKPYLVRKIFFKTSPCSVMKRYLCYIFIGFGAACTPKNSNDELFRIGSPLGVNRNERLEEASGLAASVRYPGFFWAHNDSGHPAELFLLDSTAQTRRVFTLSKIKNRDWEDITIGPGPIEGVSYLYLGDIGDNLERHRYKYIYRLQEPDPEQPNEVLDFDTLVVRLSDAIRDTEALMIDPSSKKLYLISKREENVGLYEIESPFLRDTVTANRIASLPVKQIVAADISRDGNEILLKNYDHIYYWKRNNSENLGALLQTSPIKLPYERESMGEAICWSTDGTGFYTLGENSKGERAQLLFYARNKSDSGTLKAKPVL